MVQTIEEFHAFTGKFTKLMLFTGKSTGLYNLALILMLGVHEIIY